MEAVYRLKENELNVQLLETIKKLFAGEEIIISVTSAKANKKANSYSEKLLKSVKNIEAGNYKEFSGAEFEELNENLMKA